VKSRANSLQRRSASSFRIQVNLFSIVRKRDEATAGCFFVDNRYRLYQIIYFIGWQRFVSSSLLPASQRGLRPWHCQWAKLLTAHVPVALERQSNRASCRKDS